MARSGYYAWQQRQKEPDPRAVENAVITAEIQSVFQEHRGFYGSPRIHQELQQMSAGLCRLCFLQRHTSYAKAQL